VKFKKKQEKPRDHRATYFVAALVLAVAVALMQVIK